MRNLSLAFFLILFSTVSWSQMKDFPMGRVTYKDIEMKSFPSDTNAAAVILDERGQAFFETEEGHLIFRYYVKIKILNKNGLDHANFSVPLYSNGSEKELIRSVTGSTFNATSSSMKETKYDDHKRFSQNHENWDEAKFTFPDVREGSVIEMSYQTESPFNFTFHTWEFQSNLPKVHSEYTTLIPANYLYNITMRGFLKLGTNESKIEKDCFTLGLGKADCTLTHYAIENIPAFKTEEYMTAEKNFLSAIYFDLSEVKNFTGGIDKIQKDWQEVDKELMGHERFGTQIKKAGNIWGDKVKEITGGETDDLKKAKLVYDYMKSWFTADGWVGIRTHVGARAAFDTKKGSDADINLSLIGALQQAGLTANPVLLSTRDNGLVVEVQPSISSFNYVIAAVDIGDSRYLLDATNPIRPFGMLPIACLNGKGRLIGKESSWIDIKAKDKYRTVTSMELTLSEDGHIDGKVSITYQGYDALEKRSEILSTNSEDYIKALRKEWGEIEISDYEASNAGDIEKPLGEKASIKMPGESASNASTIYMNPFIINKIGRNPFQSAERMYPVDYGAPTEKIFILSITYPPSMVVDELQKSVALALPQAGGKYIFNVAQSENKLSLTSNFTLTRPIYNSEEYHYLKELYSRIIQIQESPIVFKRK